MDDAARQDRSPTGATAPSTLLDGTTIIDMTRFLPGSLATQLLADLGADVIKIEPTPSGDFARMMRPAVAFEALNRGKRSVTIDFRRAEGASVIRRLIEGSHAFIEVSRPGTMARLGLDYAAVRQVRPDIIYCSVSGYGQNGAYADIPSHNCNIDGLAGMLDIGRADDGSAFLPQSAQLMPSGLIGGHAAAMGICAALLRRTLTGQGAYIDASCWDCGIAGDPVGSAIALNDLPVVDGFGTRTTPKYAPYWTADGEALMVCVMEHKFWTKFAAIIGRPDLTDAFGGADDYGESAPWVHDHVAAAILTRPRSEWTTLLTDQGLPVTPVHSRAEALSSAHARDRNIALAGRHRTPGFGLMIDGERGGAVSAPTLGADTDGTLLKFGFSTDEIADLRAAGTIQ